jgi:hypothetical protein
MSSNVHPNRVAARAAALFAILATLAGAGVIGCSCNTTVGGCGAQKTCKPPQVPVCEIACVTPGGKGDTCPVDPCDPALPGTCRGGFWCQPDGLSKGLGTCQPATPLGGDCGEGTLPCESGLFCRDLTACGPIAAIGGTSQVCAIPAGEDEPCDSDFKSPRCAPCGPGSTCVGAFPGGARGTCRRDCATTADCACGQACSAPGAGAGICCAACPGSTTCDIATDPDNCGACGKPCPFQKVGVVCIGGTCQCPPGTTFCDPVGCVDLENGNAFNLCGSCDVHCAQGQACSDGVCGPCPAAMPTVCPVAGSVTEACVDTQSDSNNCGGCSMGGAGVQCDLKEHCVGGQCTCGGVAPCASGQHCCAGVCQPNVPAHCCVNGVDKDCGKVCCRVGSSCIQANTCTSFGPNGGSCVDTNMDGVQQCGPTMCPDCNGCCGM